MPRKYRSPSPPRHKKYNDYDTRDTRYKSPSPVRRTRKYSPSPMRHNSSKKNSKYYSDSESDTSSESDYDSEDSESTDDESDYTSSDSSDSSSSSESDEERTRSGRSSSRRISLSNEREPSSHRDNINRKENEYRRENEKSARNNKEKLYREDERESSLENKKHKKNNHKEKVEDVEEESDTLPETGKKYNGPPRYLVISIDGQVLEQKKIYTSNTGPKNAAQKAFNRLCTEMNKKMEITVKKLDDTKGKMMTYSFRKEELNPPIEREIGGRKVTYRHKTVSC